MLFIRWNGVIGKSKILFLLRNWNFVIGTSLLELRCWNCVVGTALLELCCLKVADPRPKDLRDEIALAKPFAFATLVALAKQFALATLVAHVLRTFPTPGFPLLSLTQLFSFCLSF